MRFALQKHTTSASMARPTHLDLMLQSRQENSPDDRCLITFEIPLEPAYWGGLQLRRLEPHRWVYLDYSGPIGGERGTVERIDHGILDWRHQDERELVFALTLTNSTYHPNSGIWRLTPASGDSVWVAEHVSCTP